ncbi:MAG: TolC family outer membrane protein [Azoarcus sp.]|jgi:outer membrane protein/protease secretion system outer membrane protein|nr:TolC family outer membrane protein [Azoarcus sp.]
MKLPISLMAVLVVGGVMPVSPAARADDLLSLYREAVRADANYLAAQADAQARRELAPQALARLLPNLSFQGSNARNSVEQETANRPKNDLDYRSSSLSLGVRQPLFRPAAYATWRQAQAQVVGAEATLQWAEQDVGTRIGTAYFDVLLAEAELKVTREQRDAYLTQLDYAQKAFQSGAGTRTDIDEARSQLDLAVAQTLDLQYQLKYAEDTLKSIIDRPITSLARLDPERIQLVAPDPARPEDWIQQAEEINPRLASLRAAVEAADKQINKALSGHLPTVDLLARRFRNKSDSINNSDTKNDGNMVGIEFDVPIFSGGETMSVVRQAKAELDKARQQLEVARREVGLEVRKEFDGVAQGVHWVAAYERAVQSAEQALLSTRKGFRAGTRTTLDILTAEQNLATARRDLDRGRYRYVLAHLKLLALVGRLGEEEIGRINGWLTASAP